MIYAKMLKRLARLERKYERAKGEIERARIRKGVRNTVRKMQKLGLKVPEGFI